MPRIWFSNHKVQLITTVILNNSHPARMGIKEDFLRLQNFATADRPRCMLYDESYDRQSRQYNYGSDEYAQSSWYWNMKHQSNVNPMVSAKKSQQKQKNAFYSSQRSHSSSGFQSFFRWFKRDEKLRAVSDISYPREITSSSDTLEYENDKRIPRAVRRKLKAHDSSDTLSPPTSPRLSRAFSQSSSCDSVFSTASSFAFVPPVKYLSNRNHNQPEKQIIDHSITETYQRRIKARDQSRELDRKAELTLRKKYQLYSELSDAETSNNELKVFNNFGSPNRGYQDLSLPSARRNNLPDSAKLHDLSITKHRRTSSDTSKDKQAGAYVHVKGKRRAPPPPRDKVNPHTLSLKSSLGRKKRPAPPPPAFQCSQFSEKAASSSTSLLEDKEIKALMGGTSTNSFEASSTTSIPAVMERRTYVSPYLKIRENRKLTDEQKRILIDQVSSNSRKNNEATSSLTGSPQATKRSTPDMFSIEGGQLVYQGSESPKLSPKVEKLITPPLISPRPWFKRQSGPSYDETTPSSLKTSEKKRSKNVEKNLPEISSSRNSFFGSAGRFNIFSRIGEDSKKKECNSEKRRSQIGIPNISELDREAAEIIKRGHETGKAAKRLNASELLMLRSKINHLKDAANEDDTQPRSAKDLINKFEADSSQVNRIMLNTSFIGRREFFGEDFTLKQKTVEKKVEALSTESKETSGTRQSSNLMGLWKCHYCTLENPNWKIICSACEKIKPYEKRFCANGELIKSTTKVTADSIDKENVWDKKTEAVLKFFNPPLPTSNGLAKSSSETSIAKSLKRKSPSPSRIAGSPLMNLRRNLYKSASENHESIDVIEEEIVEKNVKKVEQVQSSPAVEKTAEPEEGKLETKLPIKTSPDINEVRSARLAKFNLMTNFKKNQFDDVNSNLPNMNRKQSPEKMFPDKLDFSDPIALELEKERLRGKIRAMNAKALTDKYPVLKKIPENRDEINETPVTPKPSAAAASLLTSTDPSKLGAIRKTFKTLLETRRGSDEKILNHEITEKPEKVSISVQTKAEKSLMKSEEANFLPTTIVGFSENEKGVKEIPLMASNLIIKQREKVVEMSDQLKSKEGIETFKATMRSKSINKTNTLAINKILRHLENAIADGKYGEAAQLATDLAKMKVSLSVTRQRDRPKSDIEENLKLVKANLTVEDGVKDISQALLDISLLMTVNDFKQKIETELKIPTNSQKLLINGKCFEDDKKLLDDCNISDDTFDVVVQRLSKPVTPAKTDLRNMPPVSDSDDETENEKVGNVNGAVGGNFKEIAKLKIEEDGWECPLCTLINMPNRLGCLACSTSRPNSYELPTRFKEIEYKLKVNEDLQTFFEMDKVEIRQQSQKNDLNRKSNNRKSSDIFNILVDEKNPNVSVNGSNEVSLQTQNISSPNITKNKYRGVDNFNPNTSYVFPKTSDIRKPVITSVIYKSSPTNAKETTTTKVSQNHYQQLVSLDQSNIAPNLEKFECSICFMDIQPKTGAVLRECLHSFCKPCLASHIKYSDEAEVKCPFMDNQYSCQSLLQEREIRSLVSKEEYDKHLTRSIRQAENKIENTFHCMTPNCRGWCIFEDTSNIFKCPVCTIVNCLTCRAVHDGINCKQYQDTLNNDGDSESAKQTKQLLQELIDKEEALNCPTCHIFLLKKWGCDWLKCSFCKTEICWVTRGPRWGPNGKGDTSSGCKCGVAGKKCSPKCNYCH